MVPEQCTILLLLLEVYNAITLLCWLIQRLNMDSRELLDFSCRGPIAAVFTN